MLQELFRIPYFNIPIYGYGLMMVLAFLASLQLARFLAIRSKIDPEIFVNMAIIALISGIGGARLSHVLENWSAYTRSDRTFGENLLAAINIREGGLTFYGGMILATFACIAYGMSRKLPIRRGMDIVAPCLMVGLGIGRIGCLLNGCCEGGRCDLPAPMGLQFPYHSNPYMRQFNEGTLAKEQMPPPEAIAIAEDNKTPIALSKEQIAERYAKDPAKREEILAKVAALQSSPVHAAQIYSTITAFMIAALLVAYFTMPHVPGRVFALMLLIEAPSRFILETLRAEPAFIGKHSSTQAFTFLPDMSFSMFLAVWLMLIGVVLWFAFRGPKDDLTLPMPPTGELAGPERGAYPSARNL